MWRLCLLINVAGSQLDRRGEAKKAGDKGFSGISAIRPFTPKCGEKRTLFPLFAAIPIKLDRRPKNKNPSETQRAQSFPEGEWSG